MKYYGKILFRSLILCIILTAISACYDRYPYFIQVPEFSLSYPEDGSAGVVITISTPDEKNLIRYTTDGSMPSESEGFLYENPVSLTTATTLRAVAYREGYPAGPVTEYYYDPQND